MKYNIKHKKMNKKGWINDILYVMVGLFVFALVIFLVYTMFHSYHTSVQNDAAFANPNSQYALNQGEVTLLLFDKLFALAVALITIALLISSYYIDTHPVFYVISLIVAAVLIVFAAQLSNIYDEVRTADGLEDTVAKYPTINLIMQNMPLYIAIMIFLNLIIIYGKVRSLSGG